MGGYRFLIVDESKFTRQLLRGILIQLGHEVVSETNHYDEALLSYQSHSPDMTIISLSAMNRKGIILLEEIKRLDAKASVIVCCSAVQQDLLVTAVKMGASGYLLKPFLQEDVQECILRHGSGASFEWSGEMPEQSEEQGEEQSEERDEKRGRASQEAASLLSALPATGLLLPAEHSLKQGPESDSEQVAQQDTELKAADAILEELYDLTEEDRLLSMIEEVEETEEEEETGEEKEEEEGAETLRWPETAGFQPGASELLPQEREALREVREEGPPVNASSQSALLSAVELDAPRRLADVVHLSGAIRFTANPAPPNPATRHTALAWAPEPEANVLKPAEDESVNLPELPELLAFSALPTLSALKESAAARAGTSLEAGGTAAQADTSPGASAEAGLEASRKANLEEDLQSSLEASLKESLKESKDPNKEDKNMINKLKETEAEEQRLSAAKQEEPAPDVTADSNKKTVEPAAVFPGIDPARQAQNDEASMNHILEQFQQMVSWLPSAIHAGERSPARRQELAAPSTPFFPEPAAEKKVTRTHMYSWGEQIDGEGKEYMVICTEGDNKLNIEMSSLNKKYSLTFSLDSFFELVGWLEEMVGRPAAEKA